MFRIMSRNKYDSLIRENAELKNANANLAVISLRASQTQQNIVISADRDSTGRRNRREHGVNCRVRERRGTRGAARKYYFCG